MKKNHQFTHLHVHSHYSLLDGLSKIPELVQHVKNLGMEAVAVTDHGAMYGVIELYREAQKAGIKPIIGMEAYLTTKGHKERLPKEQERRFHLVLLAKNNTGYRNLMELTTRAHLDGFYYKPRIDFPLLEKHHEGLICLSGCLASQVPRLILAGRYDRAKRLALDYQSLFGEGNYYLELQHHPSIPEQEKVNKALIEISAETGIPLVATQDSHYLRPEDAETQDALVAIQTNNMLTDNNRLSMRGEDYSLKSPEQMHEAFKDIPQALENTQNIARMCEVKIEIGKVHLPHYPLPKNKKASKHLEELTRKGLKKRYNWNELEERKRSKIQKRLRHELEIIHRTGFDNYFLIVQDFVNWAKEKGIVVGPGRGSAAGSIVSYLLNITDVDPIRYKLMFERFLNPERVSMPDIDIDFTDVRRDEVINYVRSRYGEDKVAHIITFGTIGARQAIRDVGRVMNISYTYCDQLAKLIPFGYGLAQTLEEIGEFRQIYQTDDNAKKLIDLAQRLEGVVRHHSIHASGVVVSHQPLTHYTPLQRSSKEADTLITQYEMHSIEALGLLKMDFLGLKNLTIIERTLEIVEKTKKHKVNIHKLPLDDKKTFNLFREGNTTGVFQLESAGMRRYLKELKPTTIEDIIAMVSLYRPGPMELIPQYIARKHGRERVAYIHKKLEPILKNTYGIPVYQEQIMQLAQSLAGFTVSEADTLRKAVGKKIKSLLDEQQEKLINGMVKNRIDRSTARKIWQYIEPFARYGFNRSHAASYAQIAYQTAYLKAHFPTQFMAALMTAESSDTERIAFLVQDANQMGIEVLPPDINESFENFTVVPTSQKNKTDKIRFGLSAIKNVGHNVVEAIIQSRKKEGRFSSASDFVERIEQKDINRKSLESLIKAGVFNQLEQQGVLLANLDNILAAIREKNQERLSGQASIFEALNQSGFTLRLEAGEDISEDQKLRWEKELLGLYISSHPLKKHESVLSKLSQPIKNLGNSRSQVSISGFVSTIKKVTTKNGKAMLFVNLEDLTGNIEVIVFPRILEENPVVWKQDNILVIEGRLDTRGGEPKLICEVARTLDQINYKPQTVEAK